jgi:hypothetical protein
MPPLPQGSIELVADLCDVAAAIDRTSIGAAASRRAGPRNVNEDGCDAARAVAAGTQPAAR